ncbi:MAG: CDP-diacylglycerol--glycerol-3-phosphate 3-phosphatidyltransferase [Rhodospirillales bacterium]|nr:CDP-diacylglycerol--glycerol-3-phosphate 3-phosphatidyltransferase [Rhodospirillales bacterium]
MVANVPNALTLFRIAAIPAIVALLYLDRPHWVWLALVLFALACVSDFLDGYIARAMRSQSELGRFLDPIADKLLVSAALLMLAGLGNIQGLTLLAAVVILCREIVVSGLREFLAALDVSIPVSRLAKWKTALQMTAIGFLIAGDAARSADLHSIGTVGLWAAAVITLFTGYDYLRASLRYIRPAENAASGAVDHVAATEEEAAIAEPSIRPAGR